MQLEINQIGKTQEEGQRTPIEIQLKILADRIHEALDKGAINKEEAVKYIEKSKEKLVPLDILLIIREINTKMVTYSRKSLIHKQRI
ncbi:hypothetical protein HON22_04330 [Candidatus Peregrinibacteria bacterium]|nr:hypothetical protein [Candidatus Peregrinibacteria bacterium]